MRQESIDRYEAGPGLLKETVAGLNERQMKSFPVPGTWSLQQLLIHLQDADLIIAERMKRIIAEERPTLLAFDHDGFCAKLDADAQSADDALMLIELQRNQMVKLLRKLAPESFERVGIHSQRGPQTLLDVVKFAASHLDHHLKFAAQKRAALQQS